MALCLSTMPAGFSDQVSLKQEEQILRYLKRQNVNCSCQLPKAHLNRTNLIESVIPKEDRTIHNLLQKCLPTGT